MMHEHEKSHTPIVPVNSPNKASQLTSGGGEGGKGGGQRDSAELNRPFTQRKENLRKALERIRQVAQRDKRAKFTALYHHVYNLDTLHVAFSSIRKDAAPGVDGVMWETYCKELGKNLQDLSDRLKRKAYRARPTRRVGIPKPDGGERLLGIPALEDKIVQHAAKMVLEVIYEADFLGFSNGFRPNRGPHKALDALYVALMTRKVNWILDADIQSFFDTIDHEWLRRFLEHRIADPFMVRLILKWLKAGVMLDGQVQATDLGTPQGGVISPLLANIFLHYVFDQWTHAWRQKRAAGDVAVIRYADDFIVGFEHKAEAEAYLSLLRRRLEKFGLVLHPKKTRLIEFGRFAIRNRERRQEGKPETFNFLGFTHICGQTRNGKFLIVRHTTRERRCRTLHKIADELRRRMHHSIHDTGIWLGQVLRGYFGYHAVPTNASILGAFRQTVEWLWLRSIRRRSQRHRGTTWDWFSPIAKRYLPPVRNQHPYPLERFYRLT